MTNLNELLEAYGKSQAIGEINHWLKETAKGDVHLSGLSGSSNALVAGAVFKANTYNHLFVLNSKEDAAYLQNDLKAVLANKEIFFFPDSFKRQQQFDEINSTNILLRTETVNRLIHQNSKAEIAVTYPEALFEKVVTAEKLNEQTLRLAINEKFDIDFAIDLLVGFDFERVDFVYEPGQFSIRGGIVDIYSFGNEFPYRIEMSDDEIISIRTFDPTSQLSQKKISSVSIVPNIQTFFGQQFKTPLFEILPKNTVIWVQDLELTLDLMSQATEKARKYYEQNQGREYETKHPFQDGSPDDVFVSVNDLLQQMKQYRILEFGSKSFLKQTEKIRFQTKPQPSFNKHFDLLIADLKANTEKGFHNFIFSDNAKQIERFYAIFNDLKADVQFTAIYESIHNGFIDETLKVACYTDHQIFNRYHKYNLKQGFSKDSQLILKTLRELKPGDFVTHIDHGVGVFSGLEKIEVGGQTQETVRLIYAGNDILYVGIQSLHKISKYSGKEGTEPRVNKLGTETWANLKKKTKKRIKELAFDLIQLYAKRKSNKGFPFSKDHYMQTELEASFMYEDTPDQAKAVEDVKRDMEKMSPMDRLVCGDVGFGKTEVAVRAAFKAVLDGKQVAVLVQTTILAMQHYKTFKERLSEFSVSVDYLNRFKSAKEKKETLLKLEKGETNIIIGTHGLVGKGVKFKDLGLMIIDEEQKFGVQVKETLKEMRATVDSLTLTATPIPRTLQFSMMGARDLSIINTPPPNRLPVTTEVHTLNPDIIKEAIEFEVYRGGQVFFVHNRVKDIAEVKLMLQKIVPDVDIAVAHGQLAGEELEDILIRFMNKEFDVLLCTNIIEAGIDIPNANTIIVNNAQHFGMSDLHQLRGRVGRSNKQAFCHLLAPPQSTLTQEARQRLKTLEDFAELGSGFNIAMRDMDIRGAGNLLGAEQSGFISEIGYDVYHKILEEAVRELKQTDFKELYQEELDRTNDYVKDCAIETDLEMLIPDSYVKNTAERMILYKQLNDIENDDQLQQYEEQITDRFGKVPEQVFQLFNGVRLKWIATKLGMEQIIIKNKHLRCYFVSNQQSAFYSSPVFSRIMQYVQTHKKGIYFRETEKFLVLNIEGITSMSKATEQLKAIEGFVFEEKMQAV